MHYTDSGESEKLPLLVLDDPVVFPGIHVTLQILESQCKACIDQAMSGKRRLFVAYKAPVAEAMEAAPVSHPYLPTGIIMTIIQVMKLPGGIFRLLLDPVSRGIIQDIEPAQSNGLVMMQIKKPLEHHGSSKTLDFLMRTLTESFARFAAQHGKIPQEILQQIHSATSPHRLSDLIAGASTIQRVERLKLLQESDIETRLQNLVVLLDMETELMEFKKDINNRTRQRMDKAQREYFINEQIKELNKELGTDDDPHGTRELLETLSGLGFDNKTFQQIQNEIKRLSRIPQQSPEAGTLRSWLECICALPWQKKSETTIDINQAHIILNEDHYDLEEAKDRILEFLAARSFNPDLKAPILCFYGPPGTGKTSLGKSLARAMGRPFHRISLGGLRDEAELRGHRRTYVGALPGKIIQSLRRIGVNNPVILLDEIDKLASDFRGDPASALLEILDPEQNNTFADHYLELPFNLRNVVFIASANNFSAIPAPLRDRMDAVAIPGYTRFEKVQIARNFIIPRQILEHGLAANTLDFPDQTLEKLVEDYTSEAGVRSLERNIVRIIRKCQRQHLSSAADAHEPESFAKRSIQPDELAGFLKNPPNKDHLRIRSPAIGLAYGLAWTEHGGRVLPVEASVVPGKGNLNLTGKLGEVMKESAMIALSVIKSLSSAKKMDLDLQGMDIHIHVPEGATPKDGPSAGITLCTALYSALTNQAIPSTVAMTGELTLSRRVLAIGGIREKILAASSCGFKKILVPEANRHDVAELPEYVLRDMEIIFVLQFEDVLAALGGIA